MNDKMYEALEVCLNALETGVEIDAVLQLYPQFADELRPILEASVQARSLAVPTVPTEAMQRGRARVLQHAAAMRASRPTSRRRWSMFAFPRLAISLALAVAFLLSGTGLVSASSGALPGDQLYPVKRSWEDLRLFFMFTPGGRAGLESEFEQERLNEIAKLLGEGRQATIAFAGLVTAQNNDQWQVSGITVVITPSSRLPADTATLIGAPVMVIGHTNAQGFVEVDTMDLLGPGASLPPLEPSNSTKSNNPQPESNQENSTKSETSSDQLPEEIGSSTYEFQGVVESMNGNEWTINGQAVNVEFAQNTSPVSQGSLVDFEGYYSKDGQFIVTKIEVKSSGLFKKEQLDGGGKNTGNSSNTTGDSGSTDGSSSTGDTHNDDGGGDN